MMNLQAMVDAIGEACRNERARYHLTLGQLIDYLENLPEGVPDTAPVCFDFDHELFPQYLDSYRGYYADLAFAWDKATRTAGSLRLRCQGVVDTEFTGYKGGEFRRMGRNTPLWAAQYGTTAGARAIVGIRYAPRFDQPSKFVLETRVLPDLESD